MTIAVDSASITEHNTFSAWVPLKGAFNVSISGIAGGTIVTVQRRFLKPSTGSALDVDTFSADGEFAGFEAEDDVEYRIGVKTGEFGSGTCAVRISH